MPGLDPEGETLAGIGKGKPVPIDKWADVYSMYEMAAGNAAVYFRKAGLPAPFSFDADDVLVMEYHLFAKIVFLFCKNIAGTPHYYPYTFDLGPQIIPELVVTGKWPAIYLPNFTRQ